MKDENENNQANENPGNFGLPEDYFQKSAHSIMNKIAWEEEHKHFPKLRAVQKESGFTLPENYFSENEQRLDSIQYPGLRAVQKINPFRVPENYFAAQEASELGKVIVSIENEAVIFKALDSIEKRNSFSVPENYFQENTDRLTRSLNPKTARLIPLFVKRAGFAVAAMLLVVIGVWIYNFYVAPSEAEDCGTIACLDKKDLVKITNLERLDDDELYELVDPTALEKKLETSGNSVAPNNKNEKDSSLENIPDELLDDI